MEASFVEMLNRLGSSSLDSATELVCSIPLLIALWAGGAAVALGFDKRSGRRTCAAVILALMIHFLVSEALLKHLLVGFFPLRVRPYLAHPGEIVPIGTQFHDSSFPSSHAASTAAALTAFGHSYPRLWPAAVLFIVLMAFARMHAGMHYPSDVLAGTVLGMAYGAAAVALVRRYGSRFFPEAAAAPR